MERPPQHQPRPRRRMHVLESIVGLLALAGVAALIWGRDLRWQLERPPPGAIIVVRHEDRWAAGLEWPFRHAKVRTRSQRVVPVAKRNGTVASDSSIYLLRPRPAGFSAEEVGWLEARVAVGGLLVAEENALLAPAGSSGRARLAKLLGITPPAWTAFHAAQLEDTSTLRAVVRTWEAASPGSNWTFRGPGLILYGPEGKVVVLPGVRQPVVSFTKEAARRWEVPPSLRWDSRFAIAPAARGAHVDAWFAPRLSPEADKQLVAAGVPPAPWPVTVRNGKPGRSTLYFAISSRTGTTRAEASEAGALRREGLRARRRGDHDTAFVLLALAPIVHAQVAATARG